jgi:hypothetical protein
MAGAMKVAWIGLRNKLHYRREAFASGFTRCGYVPTFRLPAAGEIGDQDVLLVWNRYGDTDTAATEFERRGLRVIVAENGYLGNEFCGDRWYALARNHHNGAGSWDFRGNERWDRLNVLLAPYRYRGYECVVLPQRGIGPAGVAMPATWLAEASRYGRVRKHPGRQPEMKSLEDDLRDAHSVYTWGSSAALKAMVLGVPVFYDMPKWIGASAASAFCAEPNRNEDARLDMFRRLAWAQWRLGEIASGDALGALL